MADRTTTLRSDSVERLQRLAQLQGRSLDDTLDALLESRVESSTRNWSLAIAEGMEAADITWQDEPEASSHSIQHVERHSLDKWQLRNARLMSDQPDACQRKLPDGGRSG